MRTVIDGTQDTLKCNSGQAPNWLVGDHLGSTSLVTDSAGVVVNEVRYSAFGEMRFLNGETVTDLLYTGQRLQDELGLYFYGARWYDPAVGRFIQADSFVPDAGNSASYDRYAYVENNPIRYTDPSGHFLDGIFDLLFLAYDVGAIFIEGPTPINEAALAADVVCLLIPGITGGGPAARVGIEVGELAIETAIRVPLEIRAGQTLEKLFQTIIKMENDGQNSGSPDTSSNSQNNDDAIRQSSLDDLPENAFEMYKKYEDGGWQGNVPGQTPGTRAEGNYKNKNGVLPTIDNGGNTITYQEFDINNKLPYSGRDSERFVRGSDGSLYYTVDHYKTFIKLK